MLPWQHLKVFGGGGGGGGNGALILISKNPIYPGSWRWNGDVCPFLWVLGLPGSISPGRLSCKSVLSEVGEGNKMSFRRVPGRAGNRKQIGILACGDECWMPEDVCTEHAPLLRPAMPAGPLASHLPGPRVLTMSHGNQVSLWNASGLGSLLSLSCVYRLPSVCLSVWRNFLIFFLFKNNSEGLDVEKAYFK